jgi:P-type E1-E2 ATPase
LRVGEIVGISEHKCFSGITPEGKRELIKKYPNSLMIGDGYNDVLALKDAFLSIAAHGGVDSALKSADAFFIQGGLDKLKTLYSIAERSRRQVRINLSFALIYNLIGAVLALFGMINPFVAAVLMPISSCIILVATWWGMR